MVRNAVESADPSGPDSGKCQRSIVARRTNGEANCCSMRCSASTACCASLLTATVLTPGCCTAVQIARASWASFLLPLTSVDASWCSRPEPYRVSRRLDSLNQATLACS